MLNLCRAKCVRSAAPRITFLLLRCLCLPSPTKPRRVERVRSAASPRHFAVATPTILRRAERVRSAAPHITLLLLRLRSPAAPSALAPRHSASLCGCYAYDSSPPVWRADSGRARRSMLSARLLPGRIWSRPLRHLHPRTITHDIHIHSFDPTHKFEFQLFNESFQVLLVLDWPVARRRAG